MVLKHINVRQLQARLLQYLRSSIGGTVDRARKSGSKRNLNLHEAIEELITQQDSANMVDLVGSGHSSCKNHEMLTQHILHLPLYSMYVYRVFCDSYTKK